jgi:hypothetical protein
LTINNLHDEVLLEIFDSYRQSIDSYDHQWRKKYVWLNPAHVCKKWRAVMFESTSRLDLGITVGPQKPGLIKTILSSPFPILIDYNCMDGEVTGSAFWRLRAALKHPDRVRGITFEGTSAVFDKLFKAANCPFPVLESLVLRFGSGCEPKLPGTFLKGPDVLDLHHLQRLKLYRVSLPSISGFLASATALTDLCLLIDTVSCPSPKTSLLACLQGILSLRRLELSISSSLPNSPSQPSTPENIVTLSKLIRFRYYGCGVFLNILVSGLSAPSLRDVDILFADTIWPSNVHLPRFINEIEEHYHTAHLVFRGWIFRLSLLTHLEHVSHRKPRFTFGPGPSHSTESIMKLSSTLSTKFSAVEELRVSFHGMAVNIWENVIPWRRFLQHFPSVKALRTEGANNYHIASTLLQNHEDPDDFPLLPALEQIELGKYTFSAHESQCGPELVAFEPFVSARRQAGRPAKVCFGPYWSYRG